MKLQIKALIKRILPQSVVTALRFLLNLQRTREKLRTQRIFAAATVAPSYLEISTLKTLQMKYTFSEKPRYDEHSLEAYGIKRATYILSLPGAQDSHSFLELGCWDGMVSCCLCRKGKKATAIDNRDMGFDKRASREGVNLFQMDAANLRFEDESFDFIFSYDAFEHFASPENVLREAIRVVRKGGYIFMTFGPLYYSPYGAHVYRSVPVPYCQLLFHKNLINDFVTQKGLRPIDFSDVNGWSLERYRELWGKYSHVVKRVRYDEKLNLSHLSLIRKYPSCFKSKSNYFENFIVSNISVLFQKTDHELPSNKMN